MEEKYKAGAKIFMLIVTVLLLYLVGCGAFAFTWNHGARHLFGGPVLMPLEAIMAFTWFGFMANLLRMAK